MTIDTNVGMALEWVVAGVLLFAGHLKSRRQIGKLLRRNGSSADHFGALTGVAGCPHGDTLNAAFKRMNPNEFQAIVSGMTETLIRQKVLYRYRLLDRYFLVVVDGTGVVTFPNFGNWSHRFSLCLAGRTRSSTSSFSLAPTPTKTSTTLYISNVTTRL